MITKRYHWIFDAWGIEKNLLTDGNLLDKALKDIASICKMKITAGPFLTPGIAENPGFSALCVVDFSHISIHTFSAPQDICVDIFSCKPFDRQEIKSYLLKTFKPSEDKLIFFEVKYPSEI